MQRRSVHSTDFQPTHPPGQSSAVSHDILPSTVEQLATLALAKVCVCVCVVFIYVIRLNFTFDHLNVFS